MEGPGGNSQHIGIASQSTCFLHLRGMGFVSYSWQNVAAAMRSVPQCLAKGMRTPRLLFPWGLFENQSSFLVRPSPPPTRWVMSLWLHAWSLMGSCFFSHVLAVVSMTVGSHSGIYWRQPALFICALIFVCFTHESTRCSAAL